MIKTLGSLKNELKKMTSSTLVPVITVFVIVILINMALQPHFFKYSLFRSNMLTFTPLILVAMAQGIIILVGGIDLSIGAAITLINVIMARLMNDQPIVILSVVLLSIILGVVICLTNGFFIAVLKLPSMVATFAAATIWYGLALIIMPQPGGYIPPIYYRLYLKDIFGFIPFSIIIIFVAIGIWILVKKSRLFRYIYAVGGHEKNAYASGINTIKVKLIAFGIAGVLMGIAALTITAQAATGDANLAHSFTLASVAACVIGGISLQGGKGKLVGAMLGAIIFGLLTNVIFLAKIPSLYQDLIEGLIIILALMIGVIPSILHKRVHI